PCDFTFREGKKGVARFNVSRNGTTFLSQDPSGSVEGKSLAKFKPEGQWNRLVAVLKGKSIKVTVNGESAGELAIPDLAPQGPLALKSDGEMDFANLFVRELKE